VTTNDSAPAARADRPSSPRPASCRRSVITVKTARKRASFGWRQAASLECETDRWGWSKRRSQSWGSV
jgi:hypothetical protein